MEIFTGSTPNTTENDLMLANELLKGNVNIRSSIADLKKKFEDIFPNRKVLFFNRGRDSLYFFLKLLKLKNIDEVVVQGFTCVSVIAPIVWSNAYPVYTDISIGDFNIDVEKLKEKITENTRVVIVQHTFGNIANLKEIADLIKEFNIHRDSQSRIYLIEDCAHLFLDSYEKVDVGKYSDALFFSFAQDKIISCTQGSALVIMNRKFESVAMMEYRKVDELNESEAMYNARYIVLWEKIKKDYFRKIIPFLNVTLGKLEILIFRFLGLIKKQASADSLKFDGIHKLSNLQARLLVEQFEKLKEFNTHRERITKIYCENLNKRLRFFSNGNHCLLRYPILVKNPNVVKSALRKEGVITGRWYSTPVFPMDSSSYSSLKFVSERYPNVATCCKYILNLPTHIAVSDSDALKICGIVNRLAIPI